MMWLPVPEEGLGDKRLRDDCYIAAVRPNQRLDKGPAQALGFTITAIIRDQAMHPNNSVLARAQLYSSDDKGKLVQQRTSA